jgi:large subunit ribosomal protein L22
MPTVSAKLNYLRISPRKTRAVADLLRGMSVNEAQAHLSLMPRRPSRPLLKLLESAIANAKNQKISTDSLYIKEIRVDQGPKMKRWMPRARGGVGKIEKKTSHVTLLLETREKNINRFSFIEKPKKEKKEEKKEISASRTQEVKEKIPPVKPLEKPGFFQKIFRRKSI